MVDKVQNLKGKTKYKFTLDFSIYYDEMNYLRQSGTFHFEEDPFSKNAECSFYNAGSFVINDFFSDQTTI